MASKRTIVVTLATAGTPQRIATSAANGVDTSYYVGTQATFTNIGTAAGVSGDIYLGDDSTVTNDAGVNPGAPLYSKGSAFTAGQPSGGARHVQLQDWWAVGSVNNIRLVIVLMKK
jgi:hypothetical protein